jgi:hypothetical protein
LDDVTIRLLDEHAGDSAPAEVTRQRQADWTSANDEDIRIKRR